jgi:hypothetical protein
MVPVLIRGLAYQPQIRLVNQGGSLKCLAGFLEGHPGGGQFAKLVVDQRQKLAGGVGIALLDGVKNPCDIAHKR